MPVGAALSPNRLFAPRFKTQQCYRHQPQRPPNPQLIMVDFGLSLAVVVPTTTPTTQYTAGTPAYMSPERFAGKVPDPEVIITVWALFFTSC